MTPPSVKLLEDQQLLKVVNSSTVVGDTYPQISPGTFRPHMDGTTGRRILVGVFQQVANDFGDPLLIDSHARKIGGDFYFDLAISEDGPKVFQRCVNGTADILQLKVELDLMCIQSRHFSGLAHKPVETVCFFFHHGDQVPSRFIIQLNARPQG